jgi:hypothetical protein
VVDSEKERTPEVIREGARLDAHHAPETNGQMNVCRRCGFRTLGPNGSHELQESQILRASDWLRKQTVSLKIAALQARTDT